MTATWQSPGHIGFTDVASHPELVDPIDPLQGWTDPLQCFVDALAGSSTPQSLIELAAAALEPIGAIGGALILVDDESSPAVMATTGVSRSIKRRLGPALVDGGFPAMAALRNERPYWLGSRDSVAHHFPVFASIHSSWEAYAALPLHIGHRLVGSVAFPFESPKAFDAATRLTIEAVAGLLTTGLHRVSRADRGDPTRPFLLDGMVDGACLVDSETNAVVYANEAAARLLGAESTGELLAPVVDLVNRFRLRYLRPPLTQRNGSSDAVVLVHTDRGERRLRAHVSSVDTRSQRLVVLIDLDAQSTGVDLQHVRTTSDALREDRQRVARDLHDGAIQTVFATSLTLAALALEAPTTVRERIERAIDSLDHVVRQLRSTVFDLRRRTVESPATRIDSMLEQFSVSTGVTASLQVLGSLDDIAADEALFGQLDLALHEALSNVARHARARTVTVVLRLSDDCVSFAVHDDGVGFDADVPEGDGFANLRQRAESLDGHCRWQSTPGIGTVVNWWIPRPPTGEPVPMPDT